VKAMLYDQATKVRQQLEALRRIVEDAPREPRGAWGELAPGLDTRLADTQLMPTPEAPRPHTAASIPACRSPGMP